MVYSFKSLFLTFLTALTLAPVGTYAADIPVYFKGNVTGELVTSVLTRENFELIPGTITWCQRKDVPPFLSSFLCTIKDVSATVSQTGGKSLEIKLESLVAFYKNHKGGNFREYHYKGTSAQGPVKLTLWHYVLTPETIRGFIAFENLGLTVPIVAKPAPVKP